MTVNINMEDLYSTLEVNRNSDIGEIKKSFKRLAIKNHPDKCDNDPIKAEKFKKISEAYSVLSDSTKRSKYDQFGVIDDNNNQNQNIHDIFSELFGGMAGGMGGGMSFSFSSGSPDMMFNNIFSQFGMREERVEQDEIEIKIDICDIYYGKKKKIEYELLDKCVGCDGCGAVNPDMIIKCITCNGQGAITHQIGPMMITQSMCPSCAGKREIIKNNNYCKTCKGGKVNYKKRVYELRIPKGIPNNYKEIKKGMGGYIIDKKIYKDMVYKFVYDIPEGYKIDIYNNVYITQYITLEELLCGFKKEIKLYDEDYILVSDKYFNPTNPIKINNKGCYNIKENKNGNLEIQFIIVYNNNERFKRYLEGFQKILKKYPAPLNIEMGAEQKKIIQI